ncbi:hypothetical protein [uncultured Algimonas sp.]|uniref:hypothetical protein n=1 Tax=uncultured Algimonas sp. TaxID=1547920 RepID=UPI0026268819|nr:hypothetical protein [uncultured Algimonas sp.]
MTDDYRTADTFSQTRALMSPFLGFLLLALQQGVVFSWDWGPNAVLASVLWIALALAMLLLLLTGGGWFLPRKARALTRDEPTQYNRDKAVRIGFITAMITCFIVVAVAPFDPLPAERAAHIVSSMGLGMAFLVFGIAELTTGG